MQFLFGIFTVWFVGAAALFIRDAKRSAIAHPVNYLIWPKLLWNLWLP